MTYHRLTIGLLLLVSSQAFALSQPGLPDFSALVEQYGKAVVNISTKQKISRPGSNEGLKFPREWEDHPLGDLLRRFQERAPKGFDSRSLGSGLIISDDGYIITCAHVIDRADEILVRLADRRELRAVVVGADKRSDVALIKIKAQGLPVVAIGNPALLKVGEWVLAIGSPFGFEQSATAGIVSAKERSLPNESYIPFIQTDVAINPGNSGGPLFNLKGEVVGINAQIYSRTGGFMGLSFAVPIDVAMDVVGQLKARGYVIRAWLGVSIQDVTRELAESFGMDRPRGALISEILPDSPASKSELESGDVIVRFNGHKIERMRQLPSAVSRSPVGKPATLEIVRKGKTRKLEVTLGKLPSEKQELASDYSQKGESKTLLGLVLENLNTDEQKKYGVEYGVLVVDAGSGPGSDSGITRGDVIVQLHGRPVKTVKEFHELVASLPQNRAVPILIRRGQRALYLALSISEH